MSMGAIMGGFIAVKMKAHKDLVKALKKAKAISPETAKTMNELGLSQNVSRECLTQAVKCLNKKKSVIQIGDKFYLNVQK